MSSILDTFLLCILPHKEVSDPLVAVLIPVCPTISTENIPLRKILIHSAEVYLSIKVIPDSKLSDRRVYNKQNILVPKHNQGWIDEKSVMGCDRLVSVGGAFHCNIYFPKKILFNLKRFQSFGT